MTCEHTLSLFPFIVEPKTVRGAHGGPISNLLYIEGETHEGSHLTLVFRSLNRKVLCNYDVSTHYVGRDWIPRDTTPTPEYFGYTQDTGV